MNKIIFLLFALSLSVSSFSQETPKLPPLTKEYYLIKSKQQKTTAWVFIGGGALLSAVGFSISSNRADEEIGAWFEGAHDADFATGGVVLVAGIATMLGSIPFFIASSGNKRKAIEATAFIKIENQPFVQQGSLIKTSYPAISVKFKF